MSSTPQVAESTIGMKNRIDSHVLELGIDSIFATCGIILGVEGVCINSKA